MQSVTAREAQNRFGQLVDKAQREPVAVTRRGRVVAVIMSSEEYEMMTKAEDAFWDRRAQEGQESGLAGLEEVRRLFTRMIDAAEDEELAELYRRVTDAADKADAKRTEKSG